MGGRGKKFGKSYEQIGLTEVMAKSDIAKIVEETRKIAAANRLREVKSGCFEGGVGGAQTKHMNKELLKKCACCGEYTIPVGSKYIKCDNCGWVDDPYQNQHPDSTDGKNAMTLNEAKDRWFALDKL